MEHSNSYANDSRKIDEAVAKLFAYAAKTGALYVNGKKATVRGIKGVSIASENSKVVKA